MQLEAQIRELLGGMFKKIRNQFVAADGRKTQMQLPRFTTGETTGRSRCLFGISQHMPGIPQKTLSGDGQLHVPVTAVEEHDPHRPFQHLNLAA